MQAFLILLSLIGAAVTPYGAIVMLAAMLGIISAATRRAAGFLAGLAEKLSLGGIRVMVFGINDKRVAVSSGDLGQQPKPQAQQAKPDSKPQAQAQPEKPRQEPPRQNPPPVDLSGIYRRLDGLEQQRGVVDKLQRDFQALMQKMAQLAEGMDDIANEVANLMKQQHDQYSDLDDRLLRLEQ